MRDFTSLANPILIIFVPFIFIGTNKLFYSLLIFLLINEVICSLIKVFFHKKRPIEQHYQSVIEKIDAGSFPSIHTSRITLSYLTLTSISDNLGLKLVFISIILLVMFSRVILKKHFWIDVMGGFIIGFLFWLILIKTVGVDYFNL